MWWLVGSGFQPFRYVEARAVSVTHPVKPAIIHYAFVAPRP